MLFPDGRQLFAQPQLDTTQLRLDHTTEGLQLWIDQYLHHNLWMLVLPAREHLGALEKSFLDLEPADTAEARRATELGAAWTTSSGLI